MSRRRTTVTRMSYTPQGYRCVTTQRASGKPIESGGSGDYHLASYLDSMRRISQQFDRDNGLYTGLLNRSCDCILGDGFTLQSKAASRPVREKIESLWAEFWESPEIRGLDDGPSVERLALRHLLVDGDVGTHLDVGTGKAQLVEGERIRRTARGALTDGIDLDYVGRPARFWVCDYDSAGQVKTSERSFTPDAFLFLSNRNRISQTRGIPAQQCNFAMFHRINDVCDSEAIAWQLASKLAFAVTKEEGSLEGVLKDLPDDDTATDDSAAQQYQDFGDGIVFYGKKGEKVEPFNRTIPGANFPESMRMYLRLLGLPLGFPLELVLLDWSNTNYSSARAAIKQAERMFRHWQGYLKRAWHGPLYRWKVSRWIAEGKLPNGRDIFEHEWHAPPYPFVDPQKEEQARLLRFRSGVTSPSREVKGEGGELSDLVTEQASDLAIIADAVTAHNKKYPELQVTIADFTGFVLPTSGQGPAEGEPTKATEPKQTKEPADPSEEDAT